MPPPADALLWELLDCLGVEAVLSLWHALLLERPVLLVSNVPSLLSLPWLGSVAPNDPIYLRTRRYVLSNSSNPWYFKGSAGEGVGSPHTGPYTVWPMSIIMRALTSTSDGTSTR